MTASYDPVPSVCPVCGAGLPAVPGICGWDRLHGTPGHHAIFICSQCQAGTTAPLARAEELGAFYPDEYQPHQPYRSPALGWAIDLFMRLRGRRMLRTEPMSALSDRPPGRVLDVGCGRGDLGALLTSEGWTAIGIDPSPEACAVARERGIEAHCGTLEDVSLPSHSFEAIVFQQSLEHVVDPVSDLRRARDLLADDGIVVVSLPNFGCWERSRFGTYWFGLELPRHRTHFTKVSLEIALERAGLGVERTATSTLLTGLLLSIQYRLFGRWRLGFGVGFHLLAAASLVMLPFTASLDRIRGGGELLHAVANVRQPI